MDFLTLSLASILVINSHSHFLCPGFPILPLGLWNPKPFVAAHLLPWHQIMMSQTLDDYILLLGCGAQGLTEVGIVQGATGMEGHESLETGSPASRPAGESPRELEPRLPWPGEQGLAWQPRKTAQPSSLGSADAAS